MKNLFIISALILAKTAWGQINDFNQPLEQVTPERIDLWIQDTRREIDFPVKTRSVISLLVEAKRIDLLQPFFRSAFCFGDLLEIVKKMPEDEFRQRITIMMLRTEQIAFWPNEGRFTALTGGMALVGAHNHEKEPFASIPNLLPEVKNLKARLSVSLERRKLADDMEAALAKLQEHAQPPTGEMPPTAAPLKPPPSISSLPSGSPLPPKDNTSKQPLGAAEAHNGAGIFWLIGLSVAAVGAVWWSSRRGNK